MAAIALHIGVNQVDQRLHYPLSVPDLRFCHNDAIAMSSIAEKAGFYSFMLLDSYATHDNIKSNIIRIAKKLKAGDIFLLTYSGHGMQVLDVGGDEKDGKDETWILYDGLRPATLRQMLDDELHELWSGFEAGVRIVVISDSCHSGTVARSLASRKNPVDQENLDTIKASGILIASSQDSQVSWESAASESGEFTSALLKVWDGGRFIGSYRQFRNAIARKSPRGQSPNYFTFGARNSKFSRQKPFTI